MDMNTFVEGPLLWVIFSIFAAGLSFRSVLFLRAIMKSGKGEALKWKYNSIAIASSFLPLHKVISQRPVYTLLRYIFHVCLIVVPIWFSGHIFLWEQSRLKLEWSAIPDKWADWMTLWLLALIAYFLTRRIALKDVRHTSSVRDYLLIVLTALPFMTGYFLTHGTLDSIPFFADNMGLIHVLSGEAMLIMVVFLFCSTRLNVEKCIGCAACELGCPTGTLESSDRDLKRSFSYSHYQCICCALCMKTCPQGAAELRHDINPSMVFQTTAKREIQLVGLQACKGCGAAFAPVPQLDKVGSNIKGDYLDFCPRCKQANVGRLFRRLSPWQ
jgi:formate hydrogenlyase subunit 6/NADH:ubiquinone oxidoreductase subunit I/nitrate reductase gamma subunit